mmetsp:Transcript_38279/g.93063  ORF Transcript_38279/g.93063 Transcript_38279/m.93063 type:complete len:217 (+) Transcript_38279:142-792(+)
MTQKPSDSISTPCDSASFDSSSIRRFQLLPTLTGSATFGGIAVGLSESVCCISGATPSGIRTGTITRSFAANSDCSSFASFNTCCILSLPPAARTTRFSIPLRERNDASVVVKVPMFEAAATASGLFVSSSPNSNALLARTLSLANSAPFVARFNRDSSDIESCLQKYPTAAKPKISMTAFRTDSSISSTLIPDIAAAILVTLMNKLDVAPPAKFR